MGQLPALRDWGVLVMLVRRKSDIIIGLSKILSIYILEPAPLTS